MGAVEFITSSSIVENGTSEFHHEAKEDNEAFDVSEMHAFFIHIFRRYYQI